MKHRNLFLSLLAISFVLYFGIATFAQKPTTLPTGSGDSTKPRPKDVSQIAIKRILAKTKLPQRQTQTKTNPTKKPETTVEKIEPYKTPDITETTWYLKEEQTNGMKGALIFTFRPNGSCQFERIRPPGKSGVWTGTWRQLGEDIFINLDTFDSKPATVKSISAKIEDGLMKINVNDIDYRNYVFGFESDEVLNINRMYDEANPIIGNAKESKNYDKVIEQYKRISLYFPRNYYTH